jgi:polyvinyl alcohol dehydrogenase (cytochrome)
MATGKVLWVHQAAENDAFLGGCGRPDQPDNCPKENGPDLDLGNSPVLHTLTNGKRILLSGTKDGKVFALDPDNKGAVVWEKDIIPNPKGTPLQNLDGIVWGGSKDAQNIYYGLSGGGITAVQLSTGERVWYTKFDTGGRRVSNAAASSAIPGVVFVGGTDGKLHAVNAADGKQVWEVDTAHEYDTVNKIPAKGGGMGSAGPTIVGGMLYVGSGYGVIGGNPGNALLAFGIE